MSLEPSMIVPDDGALCRDCAGKGSVFGRCCALALFGLGLVACDRPVDSKPLSTGARSEAVVRSSTPPGPEASPSGGESAVAQHVPTKPVSAVRSGQLCVPGTSGRLPDKPLGTVSASGARAFDVRLSGGRPYLINLWAAWCEPCKKEIPLLLEWRSKLRAEGQDVEIVFVSLDDDPRQLTRFLSSQQGLRETHHLAEGSQRAEFLADLDQPEDPRLPLQLLVGRDGKVACWIDGAVEPEDYELIAQKTSQL